MEFDEVGAEMVDRWSRVVLICTALFSLLFGFSIEQQILNSRQERLALLQLRSSLGLRARDWPIKSDPCTSWIGINCTNGSVTGINISGFRRTRIGSQNPRFSVDALRNLTLLSSFNASNFALPGSIPEWLGLQVAALQVLDLRSCSIGGAIPATLGNLSSLGALYLSDNNLTGVIPSSLSQLFGLTVLDLSKNALMGSIPPGVGTLSGLRFLNLSQNNLSSSIPAQLGDLSSLVDLDLGFNSLSGLVPVDLRGLRNVRRLMIRNNALSGQLSDDMFQPLTQLQSLVLSHNGFVGDFPVVLWSMPSLQLLDVSVNNFTGRLPNGSPRVNASLAVSNISHNLFYGNITPVVTRFSFIDMSGNYFEGPVPIYARGNTSLGTNCLQNVTTQRSLSACTSFYAERNLVFDNFGEPNNTQPPPPESDKKSHRLTIILASVLGGVGLIALVIIAVVLFIIFKRKRSAPNQRGIGVGPVPSGGSPPPPGSALDFSNLGDAFTYQQILKATGEFDDANLIKHGHSGDLFRGILECGIPVVIKKIDLTSSVKKESHMSELDLFSKVSYLRFVPLLGHCLDNENEKFLVYKLMPNGDLSSSLFRKTDSDDSLQSLDWITRLKIAIGAAEALSYLHHECTPPLVHRYYLIYTCRI